MAGMRSYEAIRPSLDWQKASFCQNGECVEIAAHNGMVMMRKSNEPNSARLYFTPEEFSSFLRGAKAGEFDLAR